MQLEYPTTTYSLALVDSSLLITPGNQGDIAEGDEVESLRYQPPPNQGIEINDDYLTLETNYQAILDQPLPSGLINQKITVQDLEFVFYRGHPYLAYSPDKLLLIRVPDSLDMVIDPAIPHRYVTSMINEHLYICQLSGLNRVVKKAIMTLEKDVKLKVFSEQDPLKRLENSYLEKYEKRVYLKDCYLTSLEDKIFLVTDKIQDNVCCGLACVPLGFDN